MKTSVSFYDHDVEQSPAVSAFIGTSGATHSWASVDIGGLYIIVHGSSESDARNWLIRCRDELQRVIDQSLDRALAAPPPSPPPPPVADDEVPF